MLADRLQQAVIALASGDKSLARRILRELILKDPHEEQAWILMAEAVEQREHAIDSLERALKINPSNKSTRDKLNELRGESKSEMESTPEDVSPFLPTPQLEELDKIRADFLPASGLLPPLDTDRRQSDERTTQKIGKPLQQVETDPGHHQLKAVNTHLPEEKDKGLEKELPRWKLNWPLIIGGLLVVFTIFLAYFGPSLALRDPLEMSTIYRVGEKYLTPPYPPGTPGYPLGSDSNGRDLLSRMLWGLRPTLSMVVVVAAVRLVLGTMIGLASGWSKGWPGRILDTIIAAALSIPVIIVALGGIAAVGVDLGIWAFIFGLSITGWVETARIVREQTQTVRGQIYIEAARALGASNISILLRHVTQQILSLLWMLFAFEISTTLMLTAALGFLGYYIGGDVWVAVTDSTATAISGAPELGQMLATSGVSITKPWGLMVIGALVFIVVLAFNLLGEGLRKQLSLYGKSGGTRWSRFMANFRFWFDEHISWPLSKLPQSPAFRPALGLTVVILVVAGGVFWVYNRLITNIQDPSLNATLQLDHLWSSARRDPFGTRWVQAAGPDSPEIFWTFSDESGFNGGPAVTRDGTVYMTSNNAVLYALNPEGGNLWQTELPEIPVGSPALNEDGQIFIADEIGGLSAIAPNGEIQWHYVPEDERSATTGPVVTRDGRIYYVVTGAIRALNPNGELLWEAYPASPNTAPSEMVQVSPDGEMLFWGDVILDAEDGSLLEAESLERPDNYFIGADENIYQIEGNEVARWDGHGLDADLGARLTWDHSKFTIARTPEDAGAAPDGVVWLFYTGFARGYGFGEDTRVIWLGENGDLLGNAFHPIRNSQMIGMDEEHILYTCGNLEQGYGEPQCGALSPNTEEALWTLVLEGSQEVAGGALIPGRLYISSIDGVLYALGLPDALPETRDERTEALPTQTGENLEPISTQVGILDKAEQLIGPMDSSSSLIFEDDAGFTGGPAVGHDGTVFLLSKAGFLYALTPQGELEWEVNLPANPVGTPLIGPQGEVYLSDKEGALSAYSPMGDLIWRFTPQEDFKAISGPIIGPDGSLYYTRLAQSGMVQAVSLDGEGLWLADVETSLFYHTPKVSADGDFIFFRGEVFDAQTGRSLDFNLDFVVDEYFGGEDGNNYLRAGGTVVEWKPAGEGITLAEERVLVSDEHMGDPNSAFVSSQSTVWMVYNTTIFWFTKEGEALGASSPEDAFLSEPIAIERDSSVYICGRRPINLLRNPKPICFLLSSDSESPLWEAKLSDRSEKVNGGVLVPGALYVTTEEGSLYIIGEAEVESPDLAPGDGQLFFKDTDGFTGEPAVGENDTLYITTRTGRLYSLNSQGQVNWQVDLPEDPVDHPALGPQGDIYLTHEDGSLSVYKPTGDLNWSYKPESEATAASGAAVASDGTIFYTLLGETAMIQAVSAQGENMWLSELHTSLFYQTPQLSTNENYIFFRDEIFDARNGEALEFGLDFEVDEFFIGQDGRDYLRAEGTIVAWQPVGTGITLSNERVLSSQGRPDNAGASPQGVVWTRYDDQFLWFSRQGEALGVNNTSRRYFEHFISVDEDSRIYTCGEHAQPTCYALSWSSEGPLWEVTLGDEYEKIVGTTYTLKKLYVATEEGHLYVLGGEK